MASMHSIEQLAQRMHEMYCQWRQETRAHDPPGTPPGAWEDLTDLLRDGYRAVARDLLMRPPAGLKR